MATPAQTLVVSAAVADYPAMSLRELLEAILVAVQTVAASATTLTASAAAADYAAMSDRELAEAILVAVQTGGGGSGGVPTGNYGGGAPSFTPSTSGGFAIDTSTGKLWFYFNGAWQFSGLTI